MELKGSVHPLKGETKGVTKQRDSSLQDNKSRDEDKNNQKMIEYRKGEMGRDS